MSNLLPEEHMQAVLYARRARYALVSMLIISVVALVGVAALSPALFATRSERIAVEEETELLRAARASSEQSDDRDALVATQKRIDALMDVIERENALTQALQAALERRPAGVRIEELRYSRRDGIGTLRIAGSIEEGARLQEYVAALESDVLFTSVSVPVATLADADEGLFAVAATGAF